MIAWFPRLTTLYWVGMAVLIGPVAWAQNTPAPSPVAEEAENANAMKQKAIPFFEKLIDGKKQKDVANNAAKRDEIIPIEEDVAEVWQGSLMFDKEKAAWVRSAVTAYQTKVELKFLLPELYPQSGIALKPIPEFEGLPDGPIQKTPNSNVNALVDSAAQQPVETLQPLQFFLNSIAYFTSSQWILWIDGKKYAAGDTFPDASIAAVEKNYAVFVWEDSQIDLIDPRWRDDMVAGDKGRFWDNGRNIVVDQEKGNVAFMMYANQTFDGKTLSIVEGKHVAPPATPAATPAVPGRPGAPSANTPAANTAPPAAVIDDTLDSAKSFVRSYRTLQENQRRLNILKNLLKTY